ncbi:hypothetical protein K431DRAFT_328025 [Polychaeton citri CBS 116435]|uniref:Uncharacterized protein n=1 Tax=Polychaeton citri CBS 116435 TaxID=1314669 RepID=A0A9P4QA40_9PEZI|nr:hypothetical protein K431DRAFT_328025 [Polychaeton citri CBS 116435]
MPFRNLSFPDGTSSSAPDPSTFASRLQSKFLDVMTWDPTSVWDKHLLQTDAERQKTSHGINWFVPQFSSNAVLSAGLNFSITNDLPLSPDTYVMSSGSTYTNISASNVLSSPKTPPDDKDTITIDTYFFQFAYVIVNLDEMTIALWQAKPTTGTNLVAAGGTCEDSVQSPGRKGSATNATSNGSNGSGSTSDNMVPPARSDEEVEGYLPSRTTASAAGGGVFGAAIVASMFLINFMRRRCRPRGRGAVDDAKLREVGMYRQISGYDRPDYFSRSTNILELGKTHELLEVPDSIQADIIARQTQPRESPSNSYSYSSRSHGSVNRTRKSLTNTTFETG